MRIQTNLRAIREQEKLTHVIQEEPETDAWLNQAYKERDIDREIGNISNTYPTEIPMEMMEYQEKHIKPQENGQSIPSQR